MKKILLKIAFISFVIFFFNWQCRAKSELFETLTNGLQDGTYVIETVNFMPSPIFDSEKELLAWLEAVKKNPEMVKPEHRFLQLYLSGDGFILHQLNQIDDGKYEPNGNLFLSISADSSWVFEEAANRVTIETNLVGLENAGPVAGILKAGDSYCKILRSLGLIKINSSSINQIGSNQFTGRLMQGDFFDGTIQDNAQGQITNIVCKANNASKPYDLDFEILRDNLTKRLSQVIINRREADESLWHHSFQYIIKDYSPLTKTFTMATFWMQFTNSHTLLVYFNSKNKATVIREINGKAHLLNKNDQVNNDGSIANRARWSVLVMLAISTVFGAVLLVKSVKRYK